MIDLRKNIAQVFDRGIIFPPCIDCIHIHHFPLQDRVIISMCFYVAVDRIHPNPVNDHIGRSIIAFRNHQPQDFPEWQLSTISIASQYTGTSDHITCMQCHDLVQTRLAQGYFIHGGGQYEHLDHTGRAHGMRIMEIAFSGLLGIGQEHRILRTIVQISIHIAVHLAENRLARLSRCCSRCSLTGRRRGALRTWLGSIS